VNRAVAIKSDGRIHLRSRNASYLSSRYAAIARALRTLPDATVLLVAGPIVLGEQIQAEVAVKVPPNRVNMIGVILRFVELNQKRG